MHSVQSGSAEQPVMADTIEHFGAEVLDVRAAVEQEQLAERHRQQCVVVMAESIAPLGEHFTEPVDFAVDPGATKDPPRQGESLEAAEPVELGKRAQ